MKHLRIAMLFTGLLIGVTQQIDAAPQLTLGTVNAIRGQNATLSLSLSGGTAAYAGVNAKFALPDGVAVSGLSRSALLSSAFSFDYHSAAASENGWGSVIAYSKTGTFTGAGAVLSITLDVAADAPEGTYALQFIRSGLSNSNGSVSVTHGTTAGSLTILRTSYTISGYVRTAAGQGITGVVMNGLPGNPLTNANGFYQAEVIAQWAGTVTPQKTGLNFNPVSTTYTNVTANQAEQNYTGAAASSGNSFILWTK